MKTIFMLAILILLYLAFTSGLKWCYEGSFWIIPDGCHSLKLEVVSK